MGSLISYMYYKQSVEPPSVSDVQTKIMNTNTNTEPIPIRHRPTTYEPDLQIDPTENAKNK